MGAVRLTLLRHGHAQPPEDYAHDRDRPLTPRGLEEAREVGRRLRARDWVPDVVLASPAVRTAATAQLAAEQWGPPLREVRLVPALYAADAAAIWRLIAATPAMNLHVCVCGHNPAISELAGRMGRRAERRSLPPAGMALAEWLEGDWSEVEPEHADRCEWLEP